MQVVAFLDEVAAGKPSRAQLRGAESIDASIVGCLSAMLQACHTAAGRQVKGAAQFATLLSVLKLALHTSAADVVAGILLDLRPVVNEALGAAIPEPDTATGAGGAESAAADAAMAQDSDAEGQGADGSAADASDAPVHWINQLTECLLSLLADSVSGVPVSVLRTAAEGVWRALSQHVNASALEDLLQIVARLDRKQAQGDLFQGDGVGDEEGMDAEDETASDDDNESSEDASSGGESDDGGKQVLGQAANGKADAVVETDVKPEQDFGKTGSEDGESDAGSDLDDEAMFRMDKHLAQYFTSLRAGKQVPICSCTTPLL